MKTEDILFVILRISLGFIFLWAFLDKTFGLGLSTLPEKAWTAGGSPTAGFLTNTSGVFSTFFQSLAGISIVDWLFMIGLLAIGLALILGIGLKLTSYAGTLLMILMWLALLPLNNNPFIDDHIIYALLLLLIAHHPGSRNFSITKKLTKKTLKQYPILQ